MPLRTFTIGLLGSAMAALLAMLALLVTVRGSGPASAALDAALALNLLLLPLPPLCLVALRRRERAARAHQQADAAKARMLAQLSHEIRTPMNAVMGMTQLALQTPLSAEQRELLGKADAASRMLVALLNDMLDTARLDAGQLRAEQRPLRLEEVVAQAFEAVRPLQANPAVTLVCDWADASLLAPRGQLLGDAQRLQQVLLNLLSHALRFTPEGQVLLRVAADPTDALGRVPLRLTVQHTGIGLTAEQVAGLLHDAQPDDGHTRRHGGTPLGLLTARRLIELMGGRLAVQSQPMHGSRFEVALALPPDTAATAVSAPAPRRLLLADGEPASRDAGVALLRHLGLVDPADAHPPATADAEATLAALDRAAQAGRPFDWLLLDSHLPGPGPAGAELLARLRRDHPAVRVAVLGLSATAHDAAQATAFGARALCARPLLPGELRRLLADGTAERRALHDAQSLAGLRVLLVEDHPTNQEIALRLLGSRGAQVDVAGNGQLGLDQLLALGPDAYDLVLMDLEMPVRDGLSATRRLREQPGFEALPVLAMTAHALAEERAQCLAAGMQGHIAKPLDVGRLVRELQRYRQPPPSGPVPPVLDMALGLRQFDGQAALYHRTLQGFADHYADGLAGWADWLAQGDWAELRRGAHTLQGLAATLGAQPLHRAAVALERSAAAADGSAAAGQLARVQAAFATLLAELRLALRDTAPPEPAAPAGAPADLADVPDLAELRQLLSESDSRALDWWQAHGARAGLDATTVKRLTLALDAMDFDAAAQALDARA